MTGAVLGLRFHRDDFLGGYGSFRRRIVRLGHIAMAALGMINVLLVPYLTRIAFRAECSRIAVRAEAFCCTEISAKDALRRTP